MLMGVISHLTQNKFLKDIYLCIFKHFKVPINFIFPTCYNLVAPPPYQIRHQKWLHPVTTK